MVKKVVEKVVVSEASELCETCALDFSGPVGVGSTTKVVVLVTNASPAGGVLPSSQTVVPLCSKK